MPKLDPKATQGQSSWGALEGGERPPAAINNLFLFSAHQPQRGVVACCGARLGSQHFLVNHCAQPQAGVAQKGLQDSAVAGLRSSCCALAVTW